MSETTITDFQVVPDTKSEFSLDEDITVNVRFSITGGLRDSFTEKNWTEAYDQNDYTIKLKYGVKLSKGGLRKHDLGKPIDTYRKASIFWTRNPKLVNPMTSKSGYHKYCKTAAEDCTSFMGPYLVSFQSSALPLICNLGSSHVTSIYMYRVTVCFLSFMFFKQQIFLFPACSRALGQSAIKQSTNNTINISSAVGSEG